eukprot:COSAG01_NODE_352_length_18424_cov_29.195034_5_plen_67_part_00
MLRVAAADTTEAKPRARARARAGAATARGGGPRGEGRDTIIGSIAAFVAGVPVREEEHDPGGLRDE